MLAFRLVDGICYGGRESKRGRGRVRMWREETESTAPCGHRQSEFRELALTGCYCRVHLASVQFGRGYEPIDSPYSTQHGPWRARRPRNPVSYCCALYGPRGKLHPTDAEQP